MESLVCPYPRNVARSDLAISAMSVAAAPELEEIFPVEIARDGGKFHVFSECPECKVYGLHYLRGINPEAPTLIDRERIVSKTMGGSIAVEEVVEIYDRWDERGFSLVRICHQCKWEWGQR